MALAPALAIRYGSQAMSVTSADKPEPKGSIVVTVSSLSDPLSPSVIRSWLTRTDAGFHRLYQWRRVVATVHGCEARRPRHRQAWRH